MRFTTQMQIRELDRRKPNRNIDSMCEGINYVMDTIGAGIPVMQDF